MCGRWYVQFWANLLGSRTITSLALFIKVIMMMALGLGEGCPARDVQELLYQDEAENIKCIDDDHHILHGFHDIGTWQAPTGALYVIMPQITSILSWVINREPTNCTCGVHPSPKTSLLVTVVIGYSLVIVIIWLQQLNGGLKDKYG